MGEMQDQSDLQLLRDFARNDADAAFREIVARYADLVYSAALRQVESSAGAGDIAQGVFTDLARKARQVADQMPEGHSLAGWLHRATRYAALNHLRDARRRLTNERQAMEQLLTNSESTADWEQIRPALDEALDSLGRGRPRSAAAPLFQEPGLPRRRAGARCERRHRAETRQPRGGAPARIFLEAQRRPSARAGWRS